jgi:ATP-dependent Clp protease adaptor protein ClpS
MSTKIQEDIAVIEKVKLKEPVNYNVIIHDNPHTSFEEVIFIVSRCFEKTELEAEKLAHIVNTEKRGVCGTYSREIAESKLATVDLAKQYLISCFPNRVQAITVLKFTLEEA